MPSCVCRLAFVISGQGYFPRLLWESQQDLPHLSLALVVADRPQSEGYHFFQAQQPVASVCLDFKALGSREVFEAQLLEALDRHHIDVVLFNFNRLVSGDFLRRVGRPVYNLHTSLLPLFPGFRAHRKAYEHSMKYAGATLHEVTEGMDEGPIVEQCVIRKHPDDSFEAFEQRLLSASGEMLLTWLKQYSG
jgi:phosphoribosylglycinamide formyltransferase 1